MSVINQMLKDLESRKPEPQVNQPGMIVPNEAKNHYKVIVITIMVVLGFCVLAFYIWQLKSQNVVLKEQQLMAAERLNLVTPEPQPKAQVKLTVQPKASASQPLAAEETLLTQVNSHQQNPKQQSTHQQNTNQKNTNHKNTEQHGSQHVAAQPIHRVQQGNSLAAVSTKNISGAQVKPPRASIKVSRRQLSAKELSTQKLELAEKALKENNVDKAEKLLEEVIILQPNDHQTRKKLAALWYARQSYQQAINLLSQGIALNPDDANLRIMKARMYLEQNQFNLALNTLTPRANMQHEQYQVMLANTAQAVSKNNLALAAYQVLIGMQPNEGRWPLAMAVVYDKNSEFSQAKLFYKAALSKEGLSTASKNFIQQRIQAIGR